MAAVTDWVHVYVSTACLHERTDSARAAELHAYCAAHNGQVGAKTPACCKWCDAPCQCPGHETDGAT